MPIGAAQADIFSSISSIFGGDQAYALQVSGSDQITDGKETDDSIIVTDNSGTALVPATGLSGGQDTLDSSFDQISVYVVRKNDSISQIADMFGVSANTILWANDLKKGDKLTEGDTLMILPVSGVKHTILKGQTLAGIAKKYNVDVSEITNFNEIALSSELVPGDELIIPDAEMVEISVPKTKTTNPVNTIKTALKTLVGYFINPVPGYKRLSQGLHGNNGVDLAAPTGTKIVAAASGVVLLARNGYNGGYGNMVIIKHPNGTQTLYGHQSKLATKTGAQVSQGEVIGYIGSTGHSTGPHLHFEVRGAKNPAVNL
ncbi:MAG: peptidoglycan DD-metalloendopeptidase family protein [Candidatus Paceibacterota bacterium]